MKLAGQGFDCSTVEVAVVGEAMLDRYTRATTRRFCAESRAPVAQGQGEEFRPGGAANAATAAARLGAKVRLYSVVGADEAGERLRGLLNDAGVDCSSLLVAPERSTLVKHRLVLDGRLQCRTDWGSTEEIDRSSEEILLTGLAQQVERGAAVLVADYAYGILTGRLIERLAALRSSGRIFVVDARDLTRYRTLAPTAVKPNYREALHLLGATPIEDGTSRSAQICLYRERLLALSGAERVAVTLDSEGSLLLERTGETHPVASQVVVPQDGLATSGAGDTFTAALTVALAAGVEPASAARFAQGIVGGT